MNAPRFAKLASTFLAQREMSASSEAAQDKPSYAQTSGSTSSSDATKSRARAISAIENAIRERARKKRLVRWSMGTAAMAASVLALVATRALLHHAPAPAVASNDAPSVSVALAHAAGNVAISAQNGSTSSSADGSAIAAGSKVTTREGGHAVLALSSGTRIAVDDNSDLAVVEEDAVQIFSLNSGTMRADVAKLLPGQRFVIRTADSEVEVHGTSFSVTVVPQNAPDSPAAPSCGTVTRVVVYEGIVSVRHAGIEAHVPKGNSWPSDCGSSSTTGDTNAPQIDPNSQSSSSTTMLELPDDDTHPTEPSTHAPSQHAHNSGTHHPKSSSPLAEQNDIFESGLTAERDGLTNGAVSDFERYLSLYPNGPLAEHAAVRRMNLLRTIDHARAVNAARDYLAKYPAGFARTEAQGIVQETH